MEEQPDPPTPDPTWSVRRQDRDGQRFVLATGLSREEADYIASECGKSGHRQLYWVEPDHPANAPPNP